MSSFQPVPTYADPVLVSKDKKGNDKSVFNPVWLQWFLELTGGGLGAITQHDTLAGLQGGQSGQFYHLTAAEHATIYIRASGLAVAVLTVTASPFSYTNAHTYDVDVITTAGTVSDISFSRDGITFYSVAGATKNSLRLSPGDRVKVTYTVAPTMVEVPR